MVKLAEKERDGLEVVLTYIFRLSGLFYSTSKYDVAISTACLGLDYIIVETTGILPFSVAGILHSKQWKLYGLIAWVVGLYNTLGQKEFRFILLVLPIALIFFGYSLAMKLFSNLCSKWPPKLKLAILLLLATNVPMALYMSLVHQDVMNHLSKEALEGKVNNGLFVMPCHTTPYYSTLHRNIPMQFLDCIPSKEKGIPDESYHFMMDPVGFVSKYTKNWSIPSHIVLFEFEEKRLRDFLISHSFREATRFFHAHFKVDHDLQASVVVYILTS
ncbi:hypothetical protein UlMin_011604 [Ulmus minor]